ncbi:hypothetical protein GS421_15360 [Rhodococcus hoagii]|nr:hypothetical protein [Prescottella equi]
MAVVVRVREFLRAATSFLAAQERGDWKTATWFSMVPPRNGYWMKWQRGPM